MAIHMEDYAAVKVAVTPNTGPNDAVVTGVNIDATGYRRARFTISFGVLSGSANLSTGMGVWQASTSGATSARIASASAAAITSGAISNALVVIDVGVDPSYPWVRISGMSMISSNCTNAATVMLYNANRLPPTDYTTQIIVA
jgi:hypothetical protein